MFYAGPSWSYPTPFQRTSKVANKTLSKWWARTKSKQLYIRKFFGYTAACSPLWPKFFWNMHFIIFHMAGECGFILMGVSSRFIFQVSLKIMQMSISKHWWAMTVQWQYHVLTLLIPAFYLLSYMGVDAFSYQTYVEDKLLPMERYAVEGDIMIGVILPMTIRAPGEFCGTDVNKGSLAFTYSLKWVFRIGAPCFATDCYCGVWCCGLIAC